ncbi:hypothetical protein Ddc_05791 [Ditylenchus destructor]|nr:hypothetical protein Ddc_05791 [Ditylenchus destructor]
MRGTPRYSTIQPVLSRRSPWNCAFGPDLERAEIHEELQSLPIPITKTALPKVPLLPILLLGMSCCQSSWRVAKNGADGDSATVFYKREYPRPSPRDLGKFPLKPKKVAKMALFGQKSHFFDPCVKKCFGIPAQHRRGSILRYHTFQTELVSKSSKPGRTYILRNRLEWMDG